MSPRPPSRAVNAGYTIVTLLFWFVVAFTCLEVVSIAVGIARGGKSLLWGDTLRVPAQLNPESIPHPGAVDFSGWPEVSLKVKDPTTKQMLLRSLMDLGPSLLFIAVLDQLRRIARSVKDGDPFGEANVRRLRRLGTLAVAGGIFLAFFNSALRTSLMDNLPPNRFGDFGVEGFSIPGGALLAGLGAFILAEVFAYGLSLREDVEGTV
jgi:hypothetical protein